MKRNSKPASGTVSLAVVQMVMPGAVGADEARALLEYMKSAGK